MKETVRTLAAAHFSRSGFRSKRTKQRGVVDEHAGSGTMFEPVSHSKLQTDPGDGLVKIELHCSRSLTAVVKLHP